MNSLFNPLSEAFFGAIFGSLIGTLRLRNYFYSIGLFSMFIIIWALPLIQPHLMGIQSIYIRIFCATLICFLGPYTIHQVLINFYNEVLDIVQIRCLVSLLSCWTILRTFLIIPNDFLR